jgi:hypothetical protein
VKLLNALSKITQSVWICKIFITNLQGKRTKNLREKEDFGLNKKKKIPRILPLEFPFFGGGPEGRGGLANGQLPRIRALAQP